MRRLRANMRSHVPPPATACPDFNLVMTPTEAVRGFAVAQVRLSSFDRQTSMQADVQQPDRYRLLSALPDGQPRVARGSGASYVAASFGQGVLSQQMGAFDRLLAMDDERGLLHVEAGACIGDVQRFVVSRGWYLPVAPGHPAASIGGCIATDCHGKNPARDGTFRDQVPALRLLDAQGEVHSLDAHDETGRFAATFAGFGMTGTILSATLRLRRPPAALIMRRVPVTGLAEAANVMQRARNAPILYGWHDGRAGLLGSGVIHIGLAADTPATDALQQARPKRDLPAQIRPWNVPVWNRAGIDIANRWLRHRWCRGGESPMALDQALFPLNGARRYFAGFGAAGLAEAQWLVGHQQLAGFAQGLEELCGRLRPRISLISSKLFDGVAEGLSFNGQGISLAFHVPAPGQPAQRQFLDELATLACAHGARPNLIKDSTLHADTLRLVMADLERTRARLAAFNPGGVFQSDLTRRLAL